MANAHDPLADAINAYVAARDHGHAMPFETGEQIAAYEAYADEVCDPLFWKIKGLAPTTMAGAVLALRFREKENEIGLSALDESLFEGVLAFLEGRVA